MAVRELTGPPSVLPLYLRAAAPLVPGASLLPFVPGGGGGMPDLELRLDDVRVDRERLAAYREVCGFTPSDSLPATYPHVLAFPLHMALMADGSFPFGAVGLVHVSNRIVQHRPLAPSEPLALAVRLGALEPHPRGRTFSIVSEARAGGELVWEGLSTMLRRGGGTAPEQARARAGNDGAATGEGDGGGGATPAGERAEVEWSLDEGLGRRYGAVSGDRNPIHMHALTAKPLGFPRAIAHGMWTKARCLAQLEPELPGAFSVEVRFRKPILLPGSVTFASSAGDGRTVDFSVRRAEGEGFHLEGRLEELS